MGLIETLFTTDIGLFSMFTIGFVIVIAIFFIVWINKNINKPVAKD